MAVAILEAVEGDRERDVQAVQTRLIEESILSTPARDQALLTASTYRTGVITIPQAIAAEIVPWAEKVAEIEEHIAARLRVGETREAAFAAHPRFAHVRRLRE